MNISELADWRKCTGCSACVNMCPYNAISMLLRKTDGFYYPQIDEGKCVNCGLCGKVCPINQEKTDNLSSCAFSAIANDAEIRASGSSGGIFYLFAEKVIKQGGVVFGAVYDAKNKKVKHCSTENIPLEAILRSKYVQSDIGDCYKQVKNLLAQNRIVLFSGTPCQVRGLKSYLACSGTQGKLLTVDFMCHGVPSPGLFQQFLELHKKKRKSEICNVTFREKDLGWRTLVMKIYCEDKTVQIKKALQNHYYYCFLNNYCLRDSCYDCTEYCTHVSDITMADYWHISQDKDDDKGVSLLIVNTEEGKKMIDNIKGEALIEKLSDNFTDYARYSHDNYQYARKVEWQSTYEKSGIQGVSGLFFWKKAGIENLKRHIRRIGSRMKRALKR